jgi:two-component system nitrogen regulation sensor histidine kinase GlnL
VSADPRSAIQIVDHQRTGLVLLDQQLNVLYLNPAAESLLGRSMEQVVKSGVFEVLDVDLASRSALDRALHAHESLTIRKLELVGPDRLPVLADISVLPLSDHSGVLLEIQPADTQSRFSRDDQLLSQQQASQQLLRGLAHEVKNPLGGIRGAAQLLERELPGKHLREYTQIILAEVDRLRDLVDRMMRLHGKPFFLACNVHEVLERVLVLVQAEYGDRVDLIRDYDPSLPDLNADRNQLVQACLNVVRNACQALTDARASLTSDARIVVRTRIARQVTIGRHRHRSAIRIEFEDNGPGVDPDLVERIFLPLISGRPEGSGLGLALTQTIITDHHGTIECSSRPGHTTFTMTLPVIQPKVVAGSSMEST